MTPEITYPETRRDAVVDDYAGQQVADPYRWLEADVRGDEAVTDWVAAQNAITSAYLRTMPARKFFHERITALLDNERLTAPEKPGTVPPRWRSGRRRSGDARISTQDERT